MIEEPIVHTDGWKMSKSLADLAKCLEEAESVTDEDFAEFYGFTAALDWVIGMLEDCAANPPIH